MIAAMFALLIPGIALRVTNEAKNDNVVISFLYNDIRNKVSDKVLSDTLDKCVDFYNCVRMFFWGTCILCLVIVIVGIRSAPNNWEELFADGYFRFGDTHSEVSDGMKLVLNANALAYYGIVGMSCGIMLAELAKTIFGKIFYVLLAVVCSLTGFLTVSRSWLIVTIICLIIYFAAKMRTLKGVFTVAICCMVLVLTVTKFIDANPDLFQGFITRFSDETVQDGGGRTVIMLKYMERFLQSPRLVLLGTGVTQTQAVIGISEALHNGTQQILVCYGFGGFVVYMVGRIRPIVIACRKKNSVKGIAWWLPIVTMMLFVQTILFLNPMMQMLPFVVGIFAMKIQCTDCVTKQRKMERINSVVRAKTSPENGRRENL